MIDRIKNIMKSKIFVNSFWLMLLQGFNTILPLITLPHITRVLSTSSYGRFTIAMNIIGYLQVVVEYGFGLSGSKAISRDKTNENINNCFCAIIIGRTFLFLLCCIFVVIYSNFIDSKELLFCVIILLTMVFSTIFQLTWLFQGMQEMKVVTIVSVVGRLLSVALIFAFVRSPNHLLLYCAFYSSSYLITNVLALVIAFKKYNVRFKRISTASVIKNLKEGWHTFVSSGITKVFASVGVTILALYAEENVVGIYGAILKIPTVLNLLIYPISQSIYPEACLLFSQSKQRGVRMVVKIFIPIFSIFCIVGLLLIVFRFRIVTILFGNEYAYYSNILIPLTCWFLIGIVNNFLGVQVLIASGKQKVYSLLFLISSGFLFVLNFVLCKLYEVYGISYACLISELILFIMLFVAFILIRRRWVENEEF